MQGNRVAESLTLRSISITEIDPHPKNPRMYMREDVIEQIAAQVAAAGFSQKHAVHVRPLGGRFELISGHHRVEAAKKCGLSEVPAWVDELDDDAAYMQLVLANTQGELSPLERGIHFNGSGRGVREYAREVGRAPASITYECQAAAVFTQVNTPAPDLLDKTRHLAAIHALPESCWTDAVAAMLAGGWSKDETTKRVAEAKTGSTSKRIGALFCGKTTSRELDRIVQLADQVAGALKHDDLANAWRTWLEIEDPIDVKQVQAKRIEIEDADAERSAAETPGNDALEVPSLVLADPPWRYDFAETDNRQIENQYPSATVDEIIAHRPDTAPDCVLLMWATVAKLPQALEVLGAWGFEYKTHAMWDKERIGMGYWFRGQHELLLVGTKGSASPPEQAHRVSSVFREPRGAHSAKPECVYRWIEEAFADRVKLEMYCRRPRAGWLTFGNEALAA